MLTLLFLSFYLDLVAMFAHYQLATRELYRLYRHIFTDRAQRSSMVGFAFHKLLNIDEKNNEVYHFFSLFDCLILTAFYLMHFDFNL